MPPIMRNMATTPTATARSLRKRDGSTLDLQLRRAQPDDVKIVPERAGLTAAQTRDVYYGYDLRGLQIYARFDSPAGEGITNSYDGFGRLASTTTNIGGTPARSTYRYDARRQPHPDHPSRRQLVRHYAYDALGRLTSSARAARPGSTAFAL